ncbi:unnamed protein product [Rhizophagus irregularis]|nr:unnamed protein product [Rhizophagus irregularis]
MENIKLSDDVIEQIKDFDYEKLTDEQKLLIDKLILNEELKERYKSNGLCKECKQPKASHFGVNFIKNVQLKAKNYREILEWIEYDRFENVEYLTKGGFGKIYKAIWKDGYLEKWDSENNKWIRNKLWLKQHKNFPVVLKCLHNSQDITNDILREIESHTVVNSYPIMYCYGITKDPKSNNFMMVMGYAKDGSLRQYLNNNFSSLDWVDKLNILQRIAEGLKYIHEYGLVHCDFHCGNVLKHRNFTFITDLGLCKPANVKSSQNNECEKKVYGVLPYVAPEVLIRKEYTQESDIYGFGIIAYEVCTGLPPYPDIPHEESFAINVCLGLRPKSNYKIPQAILNIIKKCWDADPLKRLKAQELYKLVGNLYDDLVKYDGEIIKKQAEEADKINEKFTSTSLPYNGTTLSYTTNPQAVYTSGLLDFKNLPEPKNVIDNNDNNNLFEEYSKSCEIDITTLNLDKTE